MKKRVVRLTAAAIVGSSASLALIAPPASAAAGGDPTSRGVLHSKGEVAAGVWYENGTTMVPRFQWNANYGYCGETSFINAGMNFGQYTSQWTARYLASPHLQQTNPSSQLLPGTNSVAAATKMRLRATRFNSATQTSTPQFLAWVKKNFVAGNVVIIGVYNNVRMLNEPLSLADPYFDHVVPVMGIGSQNPLGPYADRYFSTDNIVISDNGLHNVGPNIPYLYEYQFKNFQLTRGQASAPGGPIYSLRKVPQNFGTAVSGVLDTDKVTVPVRLSSNINGEGVQNQNYLYKPPTPRKMKLTAKVTLPNPKVAYNLYLYDKFDNVPSRGFNASAAKAVRKWQIPAGSGSSWSTTIDAYSHQSQIFRAVPVSAP